MAQKVKPEKAGEEVLLLENVHKELKDQINALLDALDERKLEIVCRFIRVLIG